MTQSQWFGSTRSNYVRVKDIPRFKAWVATLPNVKLRQRNGAFGLYITAESVDGGWPKYRGTDHENQINIAMEIATHLAPGEVFIYMETGEEPGNRLSAWATAVHSSGESIRISMDDIYNLVGQRWNCTPTQALC